MGEISIAKVQRAKRPKSLMVQDVARVVPTEEELKTLPITTFWAEKMHIESNIPKMYSHIFDKTVMVQILDPFVNRTICVNEFGQKVNSHPGDEDFDCLTCDSFMKPTPEHPSGQCGYAHKRFKERFGDTIPEGLDDLVHAMESDDHVPLLQAEVDAIGDACEDDSRCPTCGCGRDHWQEAGGDCHECGSDKKHWEE
jgi:hypothetical protein